ncbi:MAG TPA: response regulator [Kiloniellales bacterium]|nr:response regulator [Kiloniellales bacterium]
MEPAPPQPETELSLDGARILVLEDEFILLLDLEWVLQEAGGAVTTARTVRDGLDAVADGPLDAAILDLRIGLESAEPVAQALADRSVPFLFYTGQVGDDPVLRHWPSRTVLPKPAQSQTIIAAIAKLLRRP